MIEILILGIGGQGVVVAARLISNAAALSGYQSQALASYGPEIRGARVESHIRISPEKIALHSKVYEPDYLIIMDESFVRRGKIEVGVKDGGAVLVNSSRPPEALSLSGNLRIMIVDAYSIAMDKNLLLPTGLPIINTAILGAVAKMIPIIDVSVLLEAIKQAKLPACEKNVEAAIEGYQRVKLGGEDTTVSEIKVAPQVRAKVEHYPVFDPEKMTRCSRCGICYMSCPHFAIIFKVNPFSLAIDCDLCSKCGICIHECPRDAITWNGGAS